MLDGCWMLMISIKIVLEEIFSLHWFFQILKLERTTFTSSKSSTLVWPGNRILEDHCKYKFDWYTICPSFHFPRFSFSFQFPVVVPSSSCADTLQKRRRCQLCTLGDEKIRRLTRFFLFQVFEHLEYRYAYNIRN